MFCCFPPGPFLGHLPGYEEWIAHALGILVADYTCGGPHVNPSVTFAMWAWRKLSFSEAVLRIGAQMAGGSLAFPLLQFFAGRYG